MVLAFCSVFYINLFFFEETVWKKLHSIVNSADEIQQSENPTRERGAHRPGSCLAFAGRVERAENNNLAKLTRLVGLLKRAFFMQDVLNGPKMTT